jgi:hypothetical protein
MGAAAPQDVLKIPCDLSGIPEKRAFSALNDDCSDSRRRGAIFEIYRYPGQPQLGWRQWPLESPPARFDISTAVARD